MTLDLTVRFLFWFRDGILTDLELFVWADSRTTFNILYWFEEQIDKLLILCMGG